MTGLAVASLVVLAVVSLLWTILLVLVTSQLRRAAWRLQEVLRSLEMQLQPTSRHVREASSTLNRAAQGAAEGTERCEAPSQSSKRAGTTSGPRPAGCGRESARG